MSKIAHIIAIRASSLDDVGFGITTDPDIVLDRAEVWVGPRQKLETDFAFVQPIPYIVIKNGDKVLAYCRGASGGDARLHAKVSIGFGGHVDVADAVVTDDGVIDLRATMTAACVRELEEELGITLAGMMPKQIAELCDWTQVIRSDATEVDRVHIGLVAVVDVAKLPDIDPDKFEDVIVDAQWVSPDGLFTDMVAGIVKLETWTGLIVANPPASI